MRCFRSVEKEGNDIPSISHSQTWHVERSIFRNDEEFRPILRHNVLHEKEWCQFGIWWKVSDVVENYIFISICSVIHDCEKQIKTKNKNNVSIDCRVTKHWNEDESFFKYHTCCTTSSISSEKNQSAFRFSRIGSNRSSSKSWNSMNHLKSLPNKGEITHIYVSSKKNMYDLSSYRCRVQCIIGTCQKKYTSNAEFTVKHCNFT